MDDYFMRRRGHVPAFGSWDCGHDNDLPFTQCFESARQAGLFHYVPYSDVDHDRDLYVAGDLYQNHVVTPAVIVVPRRRAKGCEAQMKEGKKKQKWETGVKEAPSTPPHRPTPKPVDEDLYKISPDLLYSKPKKRMGMCLFSSCFLPNCV